MHALIVESSHELGRLWQRHLVRQGIETDLAHSESAAAQLLMAHQFDVLIIDLVLTQGSALAIADLAGFRQPDARVIFVTNSSFFSDGSIFQHSPNACAFVPADTPPEDLVAMAQHFGAHS